MLWVQHYVKGFTQMLIVLNLALWIQTQLFWMESVELDEQRNEFGANARDLQMWQLIQNVPTLTFLTFFYFFMVDIENYYIENPTSNEGTIIISDYTTLVSDWWTNYLELQ